LKSGPKTASYLSPETQNRLISCIASVMLKQLCDNKCAAKYFAIGADETSDVNKLEQLTLTARYVDREFKVCECFLGFIEVTSTTGQALGDAIDGIVYDGASTNRKALASFGFSGKMDSVCNKMMNPYYESRNIFFMCDVPHLLKAIRNNLLSSKMFRI
jgi:Domain of unknown function (DUF4371)